MSTRPTSEIVYDPADTWPTWAFVLFVVTAVAIAICFFGALLTLSPYWLAGLVLSLIALVPQLLAVQNHARRNPTIYRVK